MQLDMCLMMKDSQPNKRQIGEIKGQHKILLSLACASYKKCINKHIIIPRHEKEKKKEKAVLNNEVRHQNKQTRM